MTVGTILTACKMLVWLVLALFSKLRIFFGAEEGTRTPTPLRVRGPEPRASANSATSARCHCSVSFAEQGSNLESRKCGNLCQIFEALSDASPGRELLLDTVGEQNTGGAGLRSLDRG